MLQRAGCFRLNGEARRGFAIRGGIAHNVPTLESEFRYINNAVRVVKVLTIGLINEDQRTMEDLQDTLRRETFS